MRRDGIQKRTNGDGTTSYRAQVRIRGFAPHSKTFTRITDAKRWVEETRTAMRNTGVLSTETTQRTTLREALKRYQREISPAKKGAKRENDRVKAWIKHPLRVRFLAQLRSSDFATHRDQRRTEGRAENTIAIELKMISKLYKIASKDWGMDGLRNPIASVTMPGPSNKRERNLSADEEARLLEQLREIEAYMAPLADLAIQTAMRQGELLSLTWTDVGKARRVAHLKDTKNSEPRDVPLSMRAVAILDGLPKHIIDSAPVIPLSQDFVIRAFQQACKAAKIDNLKFHDLRHEATRRLCDKLPMHEAMRVTGRKTPSVLMRYYHPKAEDLAKKLA